MKIDKAFCNVLFVSFGFFLDMSVFTVLCNAEKYIIEAIKLDYPDYKSDGYIGLCIDFACVAIGNWIAPSIIVAIGPRAAMFCGMFIDILYVSQFLLNIDWLFYVGSVLTGFGGALAWTAQGHYLTLNSTQKTIQRNSGIFWAIAQCGAIIGNFYILFIIKGDTINKKQRNRMFTIMIVFNCLATIMMAIARKAIYETEKVQSLQIFSQAIKLFVSRDILLLCITFFYTGIELSFYVGVYSNSVGFTRKLDEKDTTLISICGILIGTGEVVGGTIFGLLGHKKKQLTHFPIVITGCVVHVVTFFLIFMNLPNASSNGTTYDKAYIESSIPIAYVCSFMLGFGDSCFVTQIYGTLGSIYAQKSASAFGIFKFIQCSACAIAFFYTVAGLHIVLYMLLLFSVLGTITFCIVELMPSYKAPSNETNEVVVTEN